jgi:GNAT superfamily N-acetyltransferase
MGRAEVRLRMIGAGEDLGPAILLSTEFSDWARGRTEADYGIKLEESEHELRLLSDLEGLRAPPARLYLAELAGEPVGIGGLKPLGDEEAEIKRMYVRPSCRGFGVGRAILQQLIDDARSFGFKTVRLESAAFMHEAHALYRRFGFVPSTSYAGREFESIRAVDDISVFMALELDE